MNEVSNDLDSSVDNPVNAHDRLQSEFLADKSKLTNADKPPEYLLPNEVHRFNPTTGEGGAPAGYVWNGYIGRWERDHSHDPHLDSKLTEAGNKLLEKILVRTNAHKASLSI